MTNEHAVQNKKAPNKKPKTKKGLRKLEKRIRHNVGQKRPLPNEQEKPVEEQLFYRELRHPTLFDLLMALSEQQTTESGSIPHVRGWGLWFIVAMIVNFFTSTYARTLEIPYQLPKIPPPAPGPRTGPAPSSQGTGVSNYNHGRLTNLFEALTISRAEAGGSAPIPIGASDPLQQHKRLPRDAENAQTGGQFPNGASLPETVLMYPSERLSPLMQKAITSVQSFEQVAALALENAGFDPYEPLPVAIVDITVKFEAVAGGAAMGTRQETMRTPIDIVRHFCTTDRGGFDILGESEVARQLIAKIKLMERKGENFFEKKGLDTIKWTNINNGIDAIAEKLPALGINLNGRAKFYHVEIKGKRTEFGAAQSTHSRAELGSIFEIRKDGETQRFAIVPHHPDLIFPVPTDKAQFRTWMSLFGTRLLYRDPSALPSNPKFVTTYVEEAGDHRLDSVRSAIRHTLHPIMSNIVKKMSDLVTYESTFAEAWHTLLGCYVPFWDAGRAFFQGDYTGAIIFAGFEIVPHLNTFKKWVFKTNFVGKTLSQTSGTNSGHGWTSLTYDSIKSANGLGFFKAAKSTKWLAKPIGRSVIANNNNNNNQ